LPGDVHRISVGRGTPRHNRRLHDRVRASSPLQQSECRVLVFEREWCRPDGTKPACLRTLQGTGREGITRGRFPARLPFRPAYIYPVQPRTEPTFSYRLLRAVYPVFRLLIPNQVIRADDLAWAMVDVVLRQTQERHGLVFENRDIRSYGQVANAPTESRCVIDRISIRVRRLNHKSGDF